MMRSLILLLAGALILSHTGRIEAEEKIIAFVGSASKPPMEEAATAFEEETGIYVELHFGGSGTMLSQLILSKRGDIYCPGSHDYMNKAVDEDVVEPESIRIIAYLIPAINVKRGNPKGIKGLEDLARPGVRVAIANPHTVCVGLYAVEVLESNGLASKVKPNIVTYTESCEKTANIISLGSVDAVIGWRVFEHWNPERIETVLLAPEEVPRIAYLPAAVARYSRNHQAADRFISFLASEQGREIFRKWGYLTTKEEALSYTPDAVVGGEYDLPSGW